MALSALKKPKNEFVDVIANQAMLSAWQRDKQAFECPLCDDSMHLVLPSNRINHFRHASGECDDPGDGRKRFKTGESLSHLAGKAYIGRALSDAGQSPIFEHRPPSGRIADIAVIRTDAISLAWEVQLSPISVSQLDERTVDYWRSGWDVCWIFSPPALGADVLRWARKLTAFGRILVAGGNIRGLMVFEHGGNSFSLFRDATRNQLAKWLRIPECEQDSSIWTCHGERSDFRVFPRSGNVMNRDDSALPGHVLEFDKHRIRVESQAV